jgi:hypothetical protein
MVIGSATLASHAVTARESCANVALGGDVSPSLLPTSPHGLVALF